MNTKFKVNEEVYVVQGYKFVFVKITEIVHRIFDKNETFEYQVVSKQYTSDGKEKGVERLVKEAFLVKDLEDARKAAKTNLEIIYNNVRTQLENFKNE